VIPSHTLVQRPWIGVHQAVFIIKDGWARNPMDCGHDSFQSFGERNDHQCSVNRWPYVNAQTNESQGSAYFCKKAVASRGSDILLSILGE
jgi:hypothetical protein